MYDSETGIFELEDHKPLMLLLGSIGHEGILSTLRAARRQYKNKFLESGVENWKSIREYFDDYEIEGVIIKISPKAISLIASDEYNEIKKELFKKIGSVPNLAFVYEDILSGHLDEEIWSEIYHRPSEEARSAVFKFLAEYDIQVLPYKRNAEVTVMAQTFIAETEQNLIFRMYVPSGRLWSNESDKLLQLFRDYLGKVAGLKVRLDQYRTDKGLIYEIYGEEVTSSSDIGVNFSEFTQFMDLCVSNLSAAEKILESKNIDQKDILAILSRYAKEAKRLSIDLKHEREQKILNIRHRLESELVDEVPGAMDWNAIGLLVDSAVPPLSGTMAAISVDQDPISLPSIHPHGTLTININPQLVETVNGVVAQEIRGDQHISSEAHRLLALIHEYAGDSARELASAVHELEDKSAPKAGRLNAKQKIKKFLIDCGGKVGDVALGVLQSYIEKQLGL